MAEEPPAIAAGKKGFWRNSETYLQSYKQVIGEQSTEPLGNKRDLKSSQDGDTNVKKTWVGEKYNQRKISAPRNHPKIQEKNQKQM